MGLPDPATSRALLIGNCRYSHPDLADQLVIRNNVIDLYGRLTDPECGAFLPEYCDLALDEVTQDSVGKRLLAAAREATDVLLVYYAGHGLIGAQRQDLFLALADTDPDEEVLGFSALEFARVRDACLYSPARTRVVILDCCYSGRAIPQTLSDTSSAVMGQIQISGAYTLTSSPRNNPSLVIDGEPHTAFTHRLIALLDEARGAPLPLSRIFQRLDTGMRAEGLPEPRCCQTELAGQLELVRTRSGPRPPTPEEYWALVKREAAAVIGRVHDDIAAIEEEARAERNRLVEAVRAGVGQAVSDLTAALDTYGEQSEQDIADFVARATDRLNQVAAEVEQFQLPDGPAAPQPPTAVEPGEVEPVEGAPALPTPPTPADPTPDLPTPTPEPTTPTDRPVRPDPTDDPAVPRLLPFGSPVYSVAFNTDGSRLAAAGQGRTVDIYELATGETQPTARRTVHVRTAGLRLGVQLLATAFNPDGTSLAVAGLGQSVRILDAASGAEEKQVGHSNVRAAAFDPTGRKLATGGQDGVVRIWPVSGGEPTAQLRHDAMVLAVAFSPDSDTLASSSFEGAVELWNVRDGQRLGALPDLTSVSALAFSPTGGLLATACLDGTVQLWNAATLQQEHEFDPAHQDEVTSLAMGDYLFATASKDRTVKVWDLSTGRLRATVRHPAPVWSVTACIGRGWLVSGCDDGKVRWWTAPPGFTDVARSTVRD